MAKKKVLILGGGVAGMSAAHELIERGFEVEVYEKNPVYPGGKARSVDVEGTENPQTGQSLPGEHGFRFFPGFYKHVTDTMKRIPFRAADGSLHSCYDNLTPTHRILLARYGEAPLITLANFPRTWAEVKILKQFIHDFTHCGLTPEELSFFKTRVLELMTSCRDRRKDQYEKVGWWEYMEGGMFSTLYQHLLVGGMVRTLVAAQAKTASTKTGGNVFLQLVFNMMTPGIDTDRVLNGPTNERWLHPWYEYLISKGVRYHLGHETLSFEMEKYAIK
ncbi:MAG: NAD(P)-binding protein, partial [Bacteroidetes bacterium]|nr:NAD(P)-binding protein [Bacteroidota bacterium]